MDKEQKTLLIVGVGILFLWLAVRRYEAESDFNLDSARRPFANYEQPFYQQWVWKHDVFSYEGWTDEGFDPSLSNVPRDIQLLSAMDYGKSDIDNGGFHQFFGNGTGVFAPEMVEWCERSELHDIADLIRRAMRTLADDDYPRSQVDRKRLLKKFPMRGSREQWDPFHELDLKFYELLSNNGSRYDDAADQWLREKCGITQLDDPPSR